MISQERKKDLACELQYVVERFLDKQWVVNDLILNITDDEGEREYLYRCDYGFYVDGVSDEETCND